MNTAQNSDKMTRTPVLTIKDVILVAGTIIGTIQGVDMRIESTVAETIAAQVKHLEDTLTIRVTDRVSSDVYYLLQDQRDSVNADLERAMENIAESIELAGRKPAILQAPDTAIRAIFREELRKAKRDESPEPRIRRPKRIKPEPWYPVDPHAPHE